MPTKHANKLKIRDKQLESPALDSMSCKPNVEGEDSTAPLHLAQWPSYRIQKLWYRR